jgi:hypothetical protein
LQLQTNNQNWEKFWLVANDDGTYSFESVHYWYVSVFKGGDDALVRQVDTPLSWEKFDLVWVSDETYCIRNVNWQTYLRSWNPDVKNLVDTHYMCGGWEKWTLEVHANALYIEIEYDTKAADTVELKPMAVATQVLNNKNSEAEQTIAFSFEKTISKGNTYSHEHGFKVGGKVSIKTGVPFFAEADVEVSTEQANNWSMGEDNTEAVRFMAESPIVVPPGKVYQGVATVKQT